ncbi:MAG: IS110 family transposase [candidate division Zixibacteria bacterium]|nr:IS110 family transposase [candidate division Zixibacteria bacterium]
MNMTHDELWQQRIYFAGLDWAKAKHDVVVVDRAGKIVMEMTLKHNAGGWKLFREKLQELAGPELSVVAVVIETNCGPAVEKLLESGCSVYPINPKAAQRYRDRKAPSGGKTDRLDAFSFSDALRTDGHGWRQLKPDDPVVQELRLLCRDEIGLIKQRTLFINQLREALHEYYPAALEAFDDWTMQTSWAFIEQYSTPLKLKKAGKRRWEKFLHSHRLYRPETYQKRLEIFARATEFTGGEAVTKAKSILAVSLAKQLRVLQQQLKVYRERIEELFQNHADHDIFDSLPGAGDKLAPRLLSELGEDRDRFGDCQSLQCYGGTAPVSFQSGQLHKVKFRYACNKNLRAAVHLWANLSRVKCSWAQIYYQQKRDEGKSHACALRCLGQRRLKILWKMWQTKTPYDEQLHTSNQIKHGSWVLALTPKTEVLQP